MGLRRYSGPTYQHRILSTLLVGAISIPTCLGVGGSSAMGNVDAMVHSAARTPDQVWSARVFCKGGRIHDPPSQRVSLQCRLGYHRLSPLPTPSSQSRFRRMMNMAFEQPLSISQKRTNLPVKARVYRALPSGDQPRLAKGPGVNG